MKIHLIRNVFISGVAYAASSVAEVDDTTGKSLIQMGKAELDIPVINPEPEKPKGKGKGKKQKNQPAKIESQVIAQKSSTQEE